MAGLIALAIVLVASGTYVVLVLSASAPQARVHVEEQASRVFEIEEAAIDWPELPAAVSTLGTETIRTNGKDALTPMGSITKLVPVLVSMEFKPYDPNDTTEYVLGQKDSDYLAEVLQDDASTGPMKVGEGVTRYEMLEQIFLPSANNYVLSYRDWIFGSDAVFLEETDKWIKKHGLSSMLVGEPTGLRPELTKSTATDLVKVAKLAMSYPVLAEIAAKKSTTINGIGTIDSANPLINDPGVRGLKTGSVREADGKDNRNIIVVRDVTVANRTVTFIGVALGQPDPEARIVAGRQLTSSFDANVQEVRVVKKGERVATVTAFNGEQIDAIASADASTVLTLDETATRTVTMQRVLMGTQAGAKVGVVQVSTPTGTITVPVELARSIPEPDAWWKLSHPIETLGWR